MNCRLGKLIASWPYQCYVDYKFSFKHANTNFHTSFVVTITTDTRVKVWDWNKSYDPTAMCTEALKPSTLLNQKYLHTFMYMLSIKLLLILQLLEITSWQRKELYECFMHEGGCRWVLVSVSQSLSHAQWERVPSQVLAGINFLPTFPGKHKVIN